MGNLNIEGVRRRCSLDHISQPTMEQALLHHDIVSGREKCPREGEEFEVVVGHPADNRVTQAAVAAKMGDVCPLCGLEPREEDFRRTT